MHMLVGTAGSVLCLLQNSAGGAYSGQIEAVSSSTGVATVVVSVASSSGIHIEVSAVAVGVCTITCTAFGGAVTTTIAVVVVAAAVGTPAVLPTQNGAGTGLLYRFVPGDYASPAALSAAVDASTTYFPPQDDILSGGFAASTFETHFGAVALVGGGAFGTVPLTGAPTAVWIRAVRYLGTTPLATSGDAFNAPLLYSDVTLADPFEIPQLDYYYSGGLGTETPLTQYIRLGVGGQFYAIPIDFDALAGALVDIRAKVEIIDAGGGLYYTRTSNITLNGEGYGIGVVNQAPAAAAVFPAIDEVVFYQGMPTGGTVREELYDASVNNNPWEPIAKAVAASVALVTTVGRKVKITLYAATSGSTTGRDRTRRLLAAASTSTTSVSARSVVTRAVSAAITGATTLVRKTRDRVAASLTATTTLVRKTRDRVSAALTTTTTLVRKARRRVSASITATTTLVRKARRRLSAALTTTTVLTARSVVLRALSAALTPTTTLLRKSRRRLSAALTATTTLLRKSRRALTASITTTTTLLRKARRRLSAVLTTTTTLLRKGRRRLSASLTSTTALAVRSILRRSIAASIAATTTLVRRVRRALSAALTATTTLVRTVRRRLSAATTSAAALTARTVLQRAVAATITLTTTATIFRGIPQSLSAAITTTTRVGQRTARQVLASLLSSGQRVVRGRATQRAATTPTTQLRRRWTYRVAGAAVTLVASVRGRMGRRLSAGVSLTRTLLTALIEAVTGWSGRLTGQITLQSRYTPEAQLNTADAEVTLQERYEGDVGVQHPTHPVRLDP